MGQDVTEVSQADKINHNSPTEIIILHTTRLDTANYRRGYPLSQCDKFLKVNCVSHVDPITF